MPRVPIIRYEHSILKVDDKVFTNSHFEKLVKYNEKNGNKFFTVGYNKIKFNSFVGVIQVGNLTIEILPKADDSELSEDKWRKSLLTMLHECRYIKLESLENAFLRLKSASIAEIFIESFLNEVWHIVQTGLVKKYTNIENNVKFLKGRLIFAKDIQKNLINKERFYTSHQIYNYNNPFNQIIKLALIIIARLGLSNYLSLNAKNLLFHFEDIETKDFSAKDFDKLRYDRKTKRYSYAINIAKLIILEYSPDISSGRDDILSILFDMNRLFEEYVCINLKRETASTEFSNYHVSGQESKLFWDTKRIRPDIVINDETGIVAILDTKWKILNDCKPSDDDLKQVYVYNLHFGSTKSMLVYPKVFLETQEPKSYQSSKHVIEDLQHSCQLYFVDLFDESGKKKPFAKKILESFSN